MSSIKMPGSTGTAVRRRILKAFDKYCLYHESYQRYEIESENGVGLLMPGYVLTDVPYTSIYGGNRTKSDYLIVIGDRRVRVEVRVQSTSGSIGEKYPYMLLNAIYAYHEKEVILLIESPGYQLGAKKWLQDRIDEGWLGFREMGKEIHLMDTDQFIEWLRAATGGNALLKAWLPEEERLAYYRTLPQKAFGREGMTQEEYDAFLQRLAKDPNAE